MSKDETHYKVSGMKCDGCIARAREALAGVVGVESAEFDLQAGAAVVTGDADPDSVASALTDIGYPAEVEAA